jgi:hypothetical protein
VAASIEPGASEPDPFWDDPFIKAVVALAWKDEDDQPKKQRAVDDIAAKLNGEEPEFLEGKS